IRGRAFVDPRAARTDSTSSDPLTGFTPSVRGRFRLLTPGAENDYEILTNVYTPLFYVIRLKTPITGEQQRLAVTYNYQQVDANEKAIGVPVAMGGADTLDTDQAPSRTMKLLRAPLNLLPARNDGSSSPPFETDPNLSPFAPTRELELRNFYNLGGQKIDPKTFTLKIRHGQDQPYSYSETVNDKSGLPQSVPYIEVLGLDSFDETGGTPIYRKSDGVIDGTLPTSTSRLFVDYENGTLFFFDPRPFAPRIKDDPAYPAKPFDKLLSNILFRRDSLTGVGDSPDERNSAIYDVRNPIRSQVSRYYMDLDFAAARLGRDISLGRNNIIENSEAVTVNGRRLERNRDYTIDYDLGKVTLTAQPGPTDQINVDYGYAPLFQQAGRTLVGSAFRLDGVDKNVGGAFLYESKGAQDLRPRLGEEPSRVLIGDLNGTWNAKPSFLTRWVDALPGVRTTTPSTFNATAEVGASFPNPNTFNEVFIDDMEGVRDAVSLTMASDHWRWSSTPRRMVGFFADSIQAYETYAETHWFNPINAVKERDLKPNLTDAQGAQNPHVSLALSTPRRPPNATPGDSLWVGLTYPLDPVGLDLSRAQYIELWVNDFNDGNKNPRTLPGRLKLHIDVGVVSEDQRRSPGIAPNGVLDTEDQPPRDNQLTVTDTRNEDTGIDGRLNAIEQPDASLVTATGDDPAGDDFHAPDVDNKVPIHNLDPDRWLRINGTEGNKSVYPFPDTEDLNLNNSLDTDENYFEYTVDLGTSSPYLADSVYASGRRYTNNGDAVPADNGWRRYRIPMTDTLRVKFGSPDLTLARHVRVWLDGITAADDQVSPSIAEKRPIVMLGGLDIVGSRWIAKDLPPGQVASGTTMTLNSVNNVDNADIYTPPFDPGSTRNGAQDLVRREQSLALEWTKLQPDDSLEAYKTFSLDEDYSRYGTLRWYVAGFGIPNYIPATGNLYYFMRFASDELGRSYYEYRAPVPPSSSPGAIAWSQVAIKLTELSNLKLAHSATPDSIDVPRPNGAPGERLIVHGRPSFTRLRRISFGVLNLDGARVYDAGRVWLDEIRATDVARDRGHAERVAVNGRMANLLDYSVNYSGQDENFLSVGQTRGSGSRTNQIAANANVDLHRFFEGTGILLPVSLTYSGNRAQPRYTAGDDVFRTGADALASESRGTTRSYSVRYSRNWGERSNPLLRYTLGGITANLGQSVTENSNPAAVDTSRALQAGVSYNISPRALVAIPIPGTKARFYPLPDRFFWNYTIATSSARSYDRQRDAPDSLLLRSATTGRTAYIDFGADSRPFDLIHHQFQGRRNLTLPEQLREQIGFINFGKVVQWNQSMDTNFGVRRGPWIQPQFGWNASYTQNNGPELSPDLSVRAVGNAQSYRLGWTLPFDQLGAAKTGARRDSLHRGPAPWMVALSKLGAVSADASYNQGSSYSRLSGTPRLGYLFGLESDPGFSGPVLAQFGNASTLTEEWRSAVRSKVGLFLGASAQTHGEFSARRASNNGVLNRENRTMFPDLDFDFGKVPEAVGLTKIFSNPRLRTAYSQSRTTDYANSPTPTSISSSSEWRPLLGLTGDLKNGTRCEFRIQHRSTQSKYMQVGSSTTSDANTDVDLSLTRAYTKGQKVSILGRESTVKTSVNLGLTGTYSRHDSETRQEGYAQPFNP
ncbi:MAG: cell surface protein SprA, partial [Candidatus Eisenbacteria bacterium]|nr:cell surface protein SprA [Candidatus Eisenbacteria bacterium]